MFDKRKQYSYKAQKHHRYKLLKVTLICLSFFIVYNCLTAFFFSVWSVESNSMQPGLTAGDRVIFSSFMIRWNRSNTEDNPYNFKRGSIVLIDKGHFYEKKLPLQIIDGIVRFFTLQKVSIFSGDGQYYVKRVIAFPGDEISMTDYIFRVKTAGNSFSLTEFELADRPYHPAIPQVPALWDDSLPFSGNMDPVILGPDEFFVISDDRSNTNDSRTWGAVSSLMLTARAVVRFWPFNKIEFL